MKTTVCETWVEVPLRQFVHDARVRFALLLHPSGAVLGQHGFTRAMDVMAACALAAAIRASSAQLGRDVNGVPFTELYHAGRHKQIFLSEASTPRGPCILLTAFDGESSLGLVQLYFRDFCRSLASAAPPPESGTKLPADFEAELNRNLAALFGPAESPVAGSRPFFPNR